MPHQPYTNGKLARDIGVLCLLAASLLLTFAYRAQVNDMRHIIYKRCMERQTYDAASNEMREKMAIRWRQFAEMEATNPFVNDKIRHDRAEAWNDLANAADKTVASQVRTSCNAYR